MATNLAARLGNGVHCPIAWNSSQNAMLEGTPALATLPPCRSPLPLLSSEIIHRFSIQPLKYASGGPGRRAAGVKPGRHGGCSPTCAFEGSFAERPLAEEARRLQQSDPDARHEVQAMESIRLYGRPTEWPDYGIGPRQQKRELLERLRREGYIVSDRVEKAMHDIDRGAFMPETATIGRYSNLVVELGYNTFMHVRTSKTPCISLSANSEGSSALPLQIQEESMWSDSF